MFILSLITSLKMEKWLICSTLSGLNKFARSVRETNKDSSERRRRKMRRRENAERSPGFVSQSKKNWFWQFFLWQSIDPQKLSVYLLRRLVSWLMYCLRAMQAIHHVPMCSPCLYWSFVQRERSKITLSILKKNYLILLKFLTSLPNCSPLLWKAMETGDSNLC